ncbi:sugar-binding protein [Candidatus Margulisiibacteriota bacterium]
MTRKYADKLILFSVVISVFISGYLCIHAEAMAKATNASPQGVYIGVFREGAPGNMNHIKKFVEQTGKQPATIMWYEDWAKPFPAEDVQKVIDYGAVPHIVWEARYWSYPGKVKIEDVIAGKWDDYIRSWAKAIKASGQPIFLRVGHEFNVGVYPWGIVNLNKEAETYNKFYRRVVDVFRKEKVKNVKWVWCLNNYSNPDELWNNWELAYPGDEYVDWIGIDGYNWGETQEWSNWEAFKGMFRNQMRRAHQLWPDKPIMIAEFSSTEIGGDKAAWIKELPGYLKTSMREIDLLIWFDVKKESDWRVKSSKKSLAAFKQIMKDPIFLSSGEGLANHTVAAVAVVPKKKVTAPYAASGVVVDGKLAEWDKSAPVTMMDSSYFKEGLSWQGTEDLSGRAYAMWDETNLYLAAVVNDNYPLVNKKIKQDIWNGDAIEIVLSADPAADPKRSSFGRKDYQIGLGTGDGKANKPTIWNWQRRRTPQGSEIAVKKSKTGYALEAKIPWEFFKAKFTPAAGIKLGFDIALDDADATGERERQFIWNGDYYFYRDPSVWGVLELK